MVCEVNIVKSGDLTQASVQSMLPQRPVLLTVVYLWAKIPSKFLWFFLANMRNTSLYCVCETPRVDMTQSIWPRHLVVVAHLSQPKARSLEDQVAVEVPLPWPGRESPQSWHQDLFLNCSCPIAIGTAQPRTSRHLRRGPCSPTRPVPNIVLTFLFLIDRRVVYLWQRWKWWGWGWDRGKAIQNHPASNAACGQRALPDHLRRQQTGWPGRAATSWT